MKVTAQVQPDNDWIPEHSFDPHHRVVYRIGNQQLSVWWDDEYQRLVISGDDSILIEPRASNRVHVR